MRPKPPLHRLLHDREQLMAALKDYQRGRAPGLAEEEIAAVITSLEERIAAVEELIVGMDD